MNSKYYRPISDEEIRAYERDGVICLRAVIDAHWCALLNEAIERDIRDPGVYHHGYESKTGHFHATSRKWQTDKAVQAYVFDSPLPELASIFMRSQKVNLLYDQMFVKEPGTEAPTPWHYDHVVWPLSGTQVI